MKDPAFLFYSKDFYEGTRMMLPDERACYVDLLVYQHQNGPIPNDLKRVLMYCSGVDKATLEATLEAKFKLTDKGWVNEKLQKVILDRSEFKNKMSINGTIGQFWKKCKTNLTKKEYDSLRKSLKDIDNTDLYKYLKDKQVDKTTLKALLKALLKHYAIEDVNANEDIDESKNEKEELELPYKTEKFKNAWNEWKDYKRKDHKFKYKSEKSEQAALTKLSNISNDENEAIEVLNQSIANGWKGMFEVKGGASSVSMELSKKQSKAIDRLKNVVDGFVTRNDLLFVWGPYEVKALQDMASKLKSIMKDKGEDPTMDNLEIVLNQVFDKLDDFYLKKFSMKIINSNLNSILNADKRNSKSEWKSIVASFD